MNQSKQVVIIGAGPAGMEAAAVLSDHRYRVTLLDKELQMGGKLNQWAHLFPDFSDADELRHAMLQRLNKPEIHFVPQVTVEQISFSSEKIRVQLSDGQLVNAAALMVTTGFQVFNAARKEEYGYGLYQNVITSAELETLFRESRTIRTSNGRKPGRIALVHCIGSRDEKCGNTYCSRVCCITAVKQAIEIKKRLPQSEVFCFYIDMRMFGHGFEELNREAQEKWNITFIRGRVSEAARNQGGLLQIKAEDTLTGRPLKMNTDLLVLMVGMEPSDGTRQMQWMLNLKQTFGGFIQSETGLLNGNATNHAGVFVAGSCKGPMSLSDTLTDARSAALEVMKYLGHSIPERQQASAENEISFDNR